MPPSRRSRAGCCARAPRKNHDIARIALEIATSAGKPWPSPTATPDTSARARPVRGSHDTRARPNLVVRE